MADAMSLPRKDIKPKFEPDVHEALAVMADMAGLGLAEFIERVVIRFVRERLSDASELQDRTSHLGILGKIRELPLRGGK